MTGLPADLAGPLHLLEPEPSRWPLWATLVAVVLLGLWFRRLFQAMSDPPRPTRPVPPALPIEPEEKHVVEVIRERYGRTGELRQGCHALARVLREHVSGRYGQGCDSRTEAEMRELLGDVPEISVFGYLGNLQFRGQVPLEKEFHQACDLTRTAMGSAPEPRKDDGP